MSWSRRLLEPLLGLRNALLLRADAFVAISGEIRHEFLASGAAPVRVIQIPNGVDLEHFRPAAPEDKARLRRGLGLPEGLLVTYSGKLNRGKGLELLVVTWARIVAQRHDAHLVLVGSGGLQVLSCEAELRALVRERALEERVTFTGYVENVVDYLQSSDVYVLASDSEGLPMALLEAMACGLPCVATRVGGVPELVKDGQTGWLIEPGDAAALEHALLEAACDPEGARARGRRARERVAEHYGIDAVARRHAELFRDLLRTEREDAGGRPGRVAERG